MTESANPNLSKFEDIFKSLIYDNTVDAALAALFVAAPWAGTPPLRQIITGLVHLAAERLFSLLRLTLDMSAIKLLNDAHQKAFDSASVKLRILAYNKGIDSPEFLKAKGEAKIALSKFVRFGSAT